MFIALAAFAGMFSVFMFNSKPVDAAYGDMGNVIIPKKFRGVWKDQRNGSKIIVGKSSIAGYKLKKFDQNYYKTFNKYSHAKQQQILKRTETWAITGTKTRKNSIEYIFYKWLEYTYPDNHYVFKKISGNKYSLTYYFAVNPTPFGKYRKIS